MQFMTTTELLQRRQELERNLQLLFNRSSQWRRDDRIRGAATIENLTQQLTEVNDELHMAKAA